MASSQSPPQSDFLKPSGPPSTEGGGSWPCPPAVIVCVAQKPPPKKEREGLGEEGRLIRNRRAELGDAIGRLALLQSCCKTPFKLIRTTFVHTSQVIKKNQFHPSIPSYEHSSGGVSIMPVCAIHQANTPALWRALALFRTLPATLGTPVCAKRSHRR